MRLHDFFNDPATPYNRILWHDADCKTVFHFLDVIATKFMNGEAGIWIGAEYDLNLRFFNDDSAIIVLYMKDNLCHLVFLASIEAAAEPRICDVAGRPHKGGCSPILGTVARRHVPRLRWGAGRDIPHIGPNRY